MNDAFTHLQRWYKSHCDGVWEHAHGITIDTLDNPGWRVSLSGERGKKTTKVFLERSTNNWISIQADDTQFTACGGIENLAEMLDHAVMWVRGS